MSALFSKPKVPNAPPVPDVQDASRAEAELRKSLTGKGRKTSLLGDRPDAGVPGQRPRRSLLGGA